MSIATYSELKTAVASWIHRGDLTAIIPDLITFGEKRIYRDLRIRAMETSFSSAIASGVIAVPSDYAELKFAYVDGSPTKWLQRKNAEWIYHNHPTRSATGKPTFIAREAGNFIFGPYPDSTYTIKGIYYAKLAALSDTNTTNWFTANAPDLLLFAALLEAEPYIKADGRIQVWASKYAVAKETVQNEDDAEDFSGSRLTITVA